MISGTRPDQAGEADPSLVQTCDKIALFEDDIGSPEERKIHHVRTTPCSTHLDKSLETGVWVLERNVLPSSRLYVV